MKNEPTRPKHALEHAPTVIHDAEAEDTLLARWLRHAMAKGTQFWLMLAGVLILATAVLFLVNGLATGDSARSVAWEELIKAKDPQAQEKVAEDFPKSPAASWARLQAAGARFNEGVAKLATDRTGALPLLKQALDLFQEVARETSKDSPQARMASFGVARTLEARDEIKEAIQQYRAVKETWPGTDEARQADRQIEELQNDENVEFYKQLYAYKPAEKTIPPGGKAVLENLFPSGHPMPKLPFQTNPTGPIRVPESRPLPDSLPELGPRTEPAPQNDRSPSAPAPASTTGGELPSDPFAP